MEGGKPENPEKNPRRKDENQQQIQPNPGLGFGPGSQRWEASAITSAPPLLPYRAVEREPGNEVVLKVQNRRHFPLFCMQPIISQDFITWFHNPNKGSVGNKL